ncbi:hypothetical protein [Marinobacter sp. F4206]|uniref:hypothetical protein n=1 Tax=Marinobacter sp. F4206 TaxID=2861777 RepID=UPI001C5CC9C7|nr:hypothetical protein [Marinobacter sp. F4206]MBW4936170.1 hypothetical protein [Marinobacter sp. F4206]
MEDETKVKIAELQQLHAFEHFRSVISMAELALKSAILVNGGACIALLTFIGNVSSSGSKLIVFGLFAFASGVFLDAVATFLAYLTQNEFMRQINEKEKHNDKQWQKRWAIRTCGGSYVAFCLGALLSGWSFLVCSI